jgi:hypothetical protein
MASISVIGVQHARVEAFLSLGSKLALFAIAGVRL